MSKKLKRKTLLLIIVEIVSLVLLGSILTVLQTNLSLHKYQADMEETLRQMDGLVANAQKEAAQSTEVYDAIYQSKASSIAYMAIENVDFECTDIKMQEYRDLLQVDNVLILDNSGSQLARARYTDADFTYARYNQLRTVFESGEASEAFEVESGVQCHRYYGAKIDSETMVVIDQNPEELKHLLESISGWEGILKNVSVGLHGYTFTISNNSYLISYHPDGSLIGTDALDSGVPVEELKKGNFTWLTLNGQKFYCGITQIGDVYVICAIPESEIASSMAVTIVAVLLIFFTVMTILIAYGILLLREEEKEGRKAKYSCSFRNVTYNKMIGRKAATLSFVGFICILLITFYMQSLFTLSRQSMSNEQHIAEVENTIANNEAEIELLTGQYNERYLNKCEIAAYIINHKPELATDESLMQLSKILEIQSINVFDTSGNMYASNSSYVGFTLSDNPKDQSYEFMKLLQGDDYLIQEPQPDDTSGEYHQYIGVVMRDSNGVSKGFVQIAVRPSRLEATLANTEISKILAGIKVGANGFAFAVDKDTKTFSYYPQEKLIGRNATEYGMKKSEFQDAYNNFLTVANETYYGSSLETEKEYVYIAVPKKELSGGRLFVALTAGGFSLFCLFVIFMILSFHRGGHDSQSTFGDVRDKARMIDIVLPDGRVKKTESAESRWLNLGIKWEEKTPEQQIFFIIKCLLASLAFIVCLAVIFRDQFFSGNSIFTYVLEGSWEHGVNIFAFTGSIVIVCFVSIITVALKKTLKLLSQTFGARGETVCRLMISFLKYVSILAVFYYCFALFGVDTKTLLASAGILTLVVGLGAKTLVSDILAGLFIIFEGEFRVGDIVMIGDYRGTVVEIGVRTTKVEDGNRNVKIISNSNVTDVINMTKRYSYACCDIGIEYGESLERVENVLEAEFPNVRKRLSAIQDGPYYKGVVSLGDNSVNIRILVQCEEADRIQLERDLNREMKLIFDKHNINIPFPQVVVNQPITFEKATAWEKQRADRFNQEQKEASKGIGNTEDDER